MRTLSATLESAQKTASYIPLWKVVLSRTSQTTQTYTKTRVLSIEHVEGKNAEIVLDNSDNTLTSLNFEHFQAVISYGITTSAGDEYSDTAPLRVRAQEFTSQAGVLTCKLTAISQRGQMYEDLAQEDYTLLDTDTRTVKTLVTAIATAATTIPLVYVNYVAHTVTYDSEDSIIDSFIPANYFVIHLNNNRGDKISELLDYTNCKMREEADGALHILVPRISGTTWVAGSTYAVNNYVQPSTPNYNFTYQCTTAGTSHATTEPTWPTVAGSTVADSSVVWTARGFHYEYQLATSAQHTFFSKGLQNRFVNPNGEFVYPPPAQTAFAYGFATNRSYLLDKKIHTTIANVTSQVQSNAIAAAMIQRYELRAATGAAVVPMNMGQELWDYVKVTDSRESSDYFIGNIQYLRRNVKTSKKEGMIFNMDIALGKVPEHLEKLDRAEAAAVPEGPETVTKTIVWAIEGTLAATANASFEIPVPTDLTCVNAWINVKTAPTGTALIVDVNLAGSTIFGTQGNRPSIAAGSTNAVSGSVSVSTFPAGYILSVDIDQVGSTVAGADLVVEVRCTEKVKK